jgi:hypothetical protein
MIRPTARTVLIFAAGIPLALLVVAYDARLFVFSFNYGILVLLAAGTDIMLAFPALILALSIVTFRGRSAQNVILALSVESARGFEVLRTVFFDGDRASHRPSRDRPIRAELVAEDKIELFEGV